MTISEFTDTFLPHLVLGYVRHELPLHALFDFDTWKKVFPDQQRAGKQFPWYQIKFTCNRLQDGTILLSFILPTPTQVGHPQFAAIRLNLTDDKDLRAIYYVLRKPSRYDESWLIFHLPITADTKRLTLDFKREIDGTNSLRNLVLTVQQIPYFQREPSSSLLSMVKSGFSAIFSTQDDNPPHK